MDSIPDFSVMKALTDKKQKEIEEAAEEALYQKELTWLRANLPKAFEKFLKDYKGGSRSICIPCNSYRAARDLLPGYKLTHHHDEERGDSITISW